MEKTSARNDWITKIANAVSHDLLVSWLEFLNMSGIVNWNQKSLYWVIWVSDWQRHLLSSPPAKNKVCHAKEFPPWPLFATTSTMEKRYKKVRKFLLNLQQYQCTDQFCTSIVQTLYSTFFLQKSNKKFSKQQKLTRLDVCKITSKWNDTPCHTRHKSASLHNQLRSPSRKLPRTCLGWTPEKKSKSIFLWHCSWLMCLLY